MSSLTFSRTEGADTSSAWAGTVELVHGRVHANLWRGRRDRHPLNIRMSLDEAEAYYGGGLDVVRNERTRQAAERREREARQAERGA